MITMNSTVKFTYRNTGTFFGVHVTTTPLDLSYSHITIASGTVPMYGGGSSLRSSIGTNSVPISLKLSFVVQTRAYVLGKLVKTKFYKKIECDITFDPTKLNVPSPSRNIARTID
ncbi:hypothetical protein V6N11_060416 [Hibiscus sabdariffa]